MELSCLTVGSRRTVKAIKPAGANGEGGVEFAGVFCVGLFPLTSILLNRWGGRMAMLVRATTSERLVLFLQDCSLELEGFLAEIESGLFGVDVLEPQPKLQ